jgi:hypothetical protein
MDSKPTTYLIRNVKHVAKVVDFLWSFKQNKNEAPKHEMKHLILVKLITKKGPIVAKKLKSKKYEVWNIQYYK